MKKLVVIFIVAVFASGIFMLAYAQGPEGAKPQEKVSIEQRKTNIASEINERINTLQELKTCVSAAQTQDDLMKCREKFREERKDFQGERKDQRKP